MRKKLSFLVFLMFILSTNAQVGIGIDTPKATLHVSENDSNPIKGVIIPNLTFVQANDMVLTNDQNTMIIYIKDVVGSIAVKRSQKMKNVYYTGFYYWNNSTWELLSSPLLSITNNFLSSNDEFETGIRLAKHVKSPTYASYYARLGNKAVDFSYAYTGAASSYGASGENSFAIGTQNIASGKFSVVMGAFNTSSGLNSMSWNGSQTSLTSNMASGNASTAWGWRTKANGHLSTALGYNTIASGALETVLGFNNTVYIPQDNVTNNLLNDMTIPINTDRILTIGNGKGVGSLPINSDALTLLRNGKLAVGIDNFETTKSDAKVQINGGIKVAAENITLASNICNSDNLGKIIFVEDNFHGCKSTGWVKLNL